MTITGKVELSYYNDGIETKLLTEFTSLEGLEHASEQFCSTADIILDEHLEKEIEQIENDVVEKEEKREEENRQFTKDMCEKSYNAFKNYLENVKVEKHSIDEKKENVIPKPEFETTNTGSFENGTLTDAEYPQPDVTQKDINF